MTTVKCPTPLRDRELLEYIQQQHESISRSRRPGSFAIEFHYDSDGRHTITHRGPVVRQVTPPVREDLTLE